ncbi:hypothetical protein [Bifidobacterium aesculapii]|uniref:hypothetical protein n=1 Tax=Bifidobacterium aesculapii TaxID=1329411 RepID=UPI00128F7E70|nr:hypothetical protein [Bifidobacterium aesculapii]
MSDTVKENRIEPFNEEKSDDMGMTHEQALVARLMGNWTGINPNAARTPSIPDFMNGIRYALKWTD